MVAEPVRGASELEELERIASALERMAATLEDLHSNAIGEAAVIADISRRFELVEILLERYQPMLVMAEQRMNGGGFGRLKRGVPRAQNRNEGG